jgi:hypothetical protein
MRDFQLPGILCTYHQIGVGCDRDPNKLRECGHQESLGCQRVFSLCALPHFARIWIWPMAGTAWQRYPCILNLWCAGFTNDHSENTTNLSPCAK